MWDPRIIKPNQNRVCSLAKASRCVEEFDVPLGKEGKTHVVKDENVEICCMQH